MRFCQHSHNYSIPFNNIKQLLLKLLFPKPNLERFLVFCEFRLVLGPNAPLVQFGKALRLLQLTQSFVVAVTDTGPLVKVGLLITTFKFCGACLSHMCAYVMLQGSLWKPGVQSLFLGPILVLSKCKVAGEATKAEKLSGGHLEMLDALLAQRHLDPCKPEIQAPGHTFPMHISPPDLTGISISQSPQEPRPMLDNEPLLLQEHDPAPEPDLPIPPEQLQKFLGSSHLPP